MEKLNWGYIQEILEQATHGSTGCPPMLFVTAYEAQRNMDSLLTEFGPDDIDRNTQIAVLERFHRHSAVLYDLGFIEIWTPSEVHLRGVDGMWIDGDEFWPKRVTALGYNFLEGLNNEKYGGRLMAILNDAGVSAARRLWEEGLDRVLAFFE